MNDAAPAITTIASITEIMASLDNPLIMVNPRDSGELA
jgi:hypothetical protein